MLVIAVLVLVLCLAVLGMIGYGYWHGSKVYTTIAEQAFPEKEADALSAMTVDWDALLAQNPDTVAWIYMPGTSIDYPVVQGDSDEEYLKKDFTGESFIRGPFSWQPTMREIFLTRTTCCTGTT